MSAWANRKSTRDFVEARLATIGCSLGNPENLRLLIPKTTEEAVAVYCDHIWGLQGEYIYKFSNGWSPLRFYREGNVVSISAYHG